MVSTTEDVIMDEGDVSKTKMEVDKSVISLKILPMLKERQQQHGLRHSDFQRYHGYCSRRLKRLRETLRMPQGDRRHFKKKEVTLADIEGPKGDDRHLEIPLTLTERSWSAAMVFKQDANTEPRKKFHSVSRLKKAVGHVNVLVQLSQDSSRVDARTKLECQAYAFFIHGSFFFELKKWTEAMENYKRAQAIYSQIGAALGEHPEAEVYNEKNAELLPSMRFCAYQAGEELQISELAAEFQSTAIEAMIASRPKMSEIQFRRLKLTVPNEKIAALLLRIDELEKRSDKTVENYEEILVNLRDAIQQVRDIMNNDPLMKDKASLFLSYLIYLRLKLTNERTELMMAEKDAKPKDSIRLLDMIIHNLGEMRGIPGLEDDGEYHAELEDSTSVYRGARCRFLADVYKTMKKWPEAIALYKRTTEYFQGPLKRLPKDSTLRPKMAELSKLAEAASIECRAQALLHSSRETGGIDSAFKLKAVDGPLIDRLETYVLDESLTTRNPKLVDLPDFRPAPVKPIFFDLALNQIGMPMEEIEVKAGMSTKKSPNKDGGGISGLVKGLWGWGGSKK